MSTVVEVSRHRIIVVDPREHADVDVDYTGGQGPTGPQGPKGDTGDTGAQGPQGPAGLDGAAAGRYVHDQTAPSGTWAITHSLGYLPSAITVYDSAGTEVEGEVLAVTEQSVTIRFSGGFSGTAIVA